MKSQEDKDKDDLIYYRTSYYRLRNEVLNLRSSLFRIHERSKMTVIENERDMNQTLHENIRDSEEALD